MAKEGMLMYGAITNTFSNLILEQIAITIRDKILLMF